MILLRRANKRIAQKSIFFEQELPSALHPRSCCLPVDNSKLLSSCLQISTAIRRLVSIRPQSWSVFKITLGFSGFLLTVLCRLKIFCVVVLYLLIRDHAFRHQSELNPQYVEVLTE